MKFDLVGGAGGNGGESGEQPGMGGHAAEVKGTIDVNSQQFLAFTGGGAGQNGTQTPGGGWGDKAGGGDGGSSRSQASNGGGGGGGAATLSISDHQSSQSVIAVAGGGGGGGTATHDNAGGAGGDAGAQAGDGHRGAASDSAHPNDAGQAGVGQQTTQSAGAKGEDRVGADYFANGAGGGGGGGDRGGNRGGSGSGTGMNSGSGGGGASGSSHVIPSASSTSIQTSPTLGNGKLTLTWNNDEQLDSFQHQLMLGNDHGQPVAVNVPNGSHTNGQPLQLDTSNNSAGQRWSYQPDPGKPGYFQLVSANTPSLCMDASTNGVLQYTCKAFSDGTINNQLWTFKRMRNGGTALVSGNGLHLTTIGNYTIPSTQLMAFGGDPSEDITSGWISTNIINSPYRAISAPTDGSQNERSIAAASGSGKPLQLANVDTTTAQQWAWLPDFVRPGYYQVVSANSPGLCMDAGNGPNSPVVQNTCLPADDPNINSQLWTAKGVSNGMSFATEDGRYLTTQNHSTDAATPLITAAGDAEGDTTAGWSVYISNS
ncbi:RICIN domain-containing protein [Streptomyces sp. NPDC058251]|uniref:RICIN domain-containing protein n=1 Tax=unclassified Streptomyces TaxID=2593676 RepID=UPI003662AF6E